MTPKIKKAIFEIIRCNLPDDFKNNVFWANERKKEPDKPYCMLIQTVPEQKTGRTTEREIAGNINEVTMFKSAVITAATFVKGTLNGKKNDLDELNEYAKETARNLKNSFETIDSALELNEEGLSCNVISELRDLTTPIDGGYNYRYEFDLTFGFNETMQIQKLVGQNVILDIKEKNLND